MTLEEASQKASETWDDGGAAYKVRAYSDYYHVGYWELDDTADPFRYTFHSKGHGISFEEAFRHAGVI